MMGVVHIVFGCWILCSTTVLAFDGQLQLYPEGDQYLIVGDKLRVNCTLLRNGSEFDLNNVYMKKGVEYIHNAMFNRYEDDNTLEMIITNTSVNDSGSYLCYYGNDTHIQSLTIVSVVEMPGEPKNITCLSYRLFDMTCWFNLTKSTNLPMRWRMEYKLKGSSKYTVNCSSVTEYEVKCLTVPNNKLPQFRKYEVYVEGINETYNVNMSTSFVVYYNYTLAQFGPVQNLAVTMGTDNAVIQWKCPKFKCNIRSLVYDYKVLIKTSEVNWQTIERFVPGNNNTERNITVDGLIPYVNYTVAVWGKPAGADGEIYWSDPSILEVITFPDVPPYSVAMESGSYTVSDCGDFMCAILYWKNPEERYWFGQIVGYEVVVKTNSSAMAQPSAVRHSRSIQTKGVVEYRNGLSEYLRLNTSLRKTDGYSLTVSLLNTVGKSKNVANVSISDWDNEQRLQASWVSVELSSDAGISWEIDPHLCRQIVSVTVYWCLGQQVNTTFMQCQGNFGWDSFKVNDGCKENVKHISTNATRYEDLKYGVSIATDNISGGIRWENFRFKNSKDVPVMTLFSVKAEYTSLTINILYSVYYVSDGGRPLNYHVSYREAKDEQMDCMNDGTKMKFPVNFSHPFYEIPDLDSGTLYEICVWSSNTAGHSDIAIPTRIETKEDSTGLIVVLSIVIPIAVILFIVIVCLGYKARRRRLIKENRTELPPNFDHLIDDSNGIDKSKQPCTEQDSGKGDSPISSLSNGFLNVGGSAEEGSTGDIGITDNLSLNAFGRTEKEMSPVLPGYSRGLNGIVDIDDSNESNSLLEWQDADDSTFKCFKSGGNCIEVAGKDEEGADVKKSKDTPTDTEYVDHDFPHGKSSAQTRKINSISPMVQTNQSMPKSDQEYLHHSDIKMDTVRHANKTAIQPLPISSVTDAYVDESKNPVTNKLAYENTVFCNRPEHFYYDIDEKGGHLKSDNTVERTAYQERNQSESQMIYKSNESISSPQLDSYPVACPGDINADKGGNREVSDHRTDSCAVDLDANNENDCLEDVLDNRIPPPSDESFGLDDDDSVDEYSESKFSAASSDDSSDNIFGIYSNSVYQKPDALSLGGASTISDVSESGSICSDRCENESFTREMSPEIELAKTALCQDIQALVERNMANDKSHISDVQAELDKSVNVLDEKTDGIEEISSSENTSVGTRMDSSDSYLMVGFTSPNQSGQDLPPVLDENPPVLHENPLVLDKNNVVKVKVDLRNECTHL